MKKEVIKDGMKSKVSKKLKEFINSISIIGDSNIPDDDCKIYYSKVDGSYLTRVGMENNLNFLLKMGITEQIQDGFGEPKTCCLGFNPKEQKWYGWSHRAIFGFGVGSKCKKGDCAYNTSIKENYADKCLALWVDEYSSGDNKVEFVKGIGSNNQKVDGVLISYTYNDKVPNEKLRGTAFSHFCEFPNKWGKGEWTAKTLEEAKTMAIDFAKNIS